MREPNLPTDPAASCERFATYRQPHGNREGPTFLSVSIERRESRPSSWRRWGAFSPSVVFAKDRSSRGVNILSSAVVAKRLRRLHDLLPNAVLIAVLVDPGNASITKTTVQDVQKAANPDNKCNHGRRDQRGLRHI
jgi:hypothetical protein